VYVFGALAHWSELADVNGGDGELATVCRLTQSKVERGEGIYALRKVRRSPQVHKRGGGADGETWPHTRCCGGDGRARSGQTMARGMVPSKENHLWDIETREREVERRDKFRWRPTT
jgi:hypothetical protein